MNLLCEVISVCVLAAWLVYRVSVSLKPPPLNLETLFMSELSAGDILLISPKFHYHRHGHMLIVLRHPYYHQKFVYHKRNNNQAALVPLESFIRKLLQRQTRVYVRKLLTGTVPLVSTPPVMYDFSTVLEYANGDGSKIMKLPKLPALNQQNHPNMQTCSSFVMHYLMYTGVLQPQATQPYTRLLPDQILFSLDLNALTTPSYKYDNKVKKVFI